MRKLIVGISAVLMLLTLSGRPAGAWGTEQQQVPCDFVTGGGFIVGRGGSDLQAGAHGNFGVGGGVKNGAFWGHLEYNDHGSSPLRTVHGTSVTGYSQSSSCLGTSGPTRDITGTCQINQTVDCTYIVRVTDNGEPGANHDEFSIRVMVGGSVVYQAGTCFGDGPIVGGNIQVHKGNASNTPPSGFTCE
jgi:hypothetical protein